MVCRAEKIMGDFISKKRNEFNDFHIYGRRREEKTGGQGKQCLFYNALFCTRKFLLVLCESVSRCLAQKTLNKI